MKRNIIAVMLIMMVVFSAACGSDEAPEGATMTVDENGNVTTVDTADPADVKALEMVKKMDLEAKVAQLFFGEVRDAEEFGLSIGGIILFDADITNHDQVTTLIDTYQKKADIPLFIGVDEEGGRVANLSKNEDMGVTHFPAMESIGSSGDYMKAGEVAQVQGNELHELGFNVNFAPVADLVTGSENIEIGDRSFGSDPELVSEMVSEYVYWLQSENVSAVLKHFPGQGSSTADTHEGTSTINKSLDELWKSDLVPFASAIGVGDECDFVMVSHITVPKIDTAKVPCSLSNKIVTEVLRDDIGFSGIAITDSMQMEAITDNYSAGEAAVMTIDAGEDMILMSDDIELAYSAVLKAVKSGKISESKINNSVQRILRIKIARDVIDN